MLNTTLSAAALFCIATFASTAQAQDTSRYSLTEKVQVSDLDVSSEAGVRVLYDRLEKAVFRVCRADGPPVGSIEFTKCQRQLLDQAVAEANIPKLTALNNPSASRAVSASG